MSKIFTNINEEGYCENCLVGHNCLNCKVMDLLVDSKFKIKKIIEKKEKADVICGKCGGVMLKKTKKSNSEQFWCPTCYKK